MLLFHGSNVGVEKPRILESDRRLDFGTGFYLTSDYDQAKRWAHLTTIRRAEGEELISIFEFDKNMLSSLKILKFTEATVEWLKFVSNNRNNQSYHSDYDIVIGPVADDRTMPVIRRYFSGVYTEEETIKRLLPQKLKNQYAFCTEEAIKTLVLRGVEKSGK